MNQYQTIATLLLTLLIVSGCKPDSGKHFIAGRPEVFKKSVYGLGSVEFKVIQEIRAPRIFDARELQIAYVAASGQSVAEGDVVLSFSDTQLRYEKQRKVAELLELKNRFETAMDEMRVSIASDESLESQDHWLVKEADLSLQGTLGSTALEIQAIRDQKQVAATRLSVIGDRIIERKQMLNDLSRKAENALRQKVKQVRSLESDLQFLTLRAESDGIFIAQKGEWNDVPTVGQLVPARFPVGTVADPRYTLAALLVSRSEAEVLRVGQPAKICSTARPVCVNGDIASITAVSNGVLGEIRFRVLVDLPEEAEFSLGEGIYGELVYEETTGILIPSALVRTADGSARLSVLEGLRIRRVSVTYEKVGPSWILVKDGLAAGDRVIYELE